jgi:hypothetical protein
MPHDDEAEDLMRELESLSVRLHLKQREVAMIAAARDRARARLRAIAATGSIVWRSQSNVELTGVTCRHSTNGLNAFTLALGELSKEMTCKVMTSKEPWNATWERTAAPRKIDMDLRWVSVEPTPGEREAADVIRAAGITADKTWLAKRLGCTEDAATIRLARAAQKGLLVRTGRGLYYAPPVPGEAGVKVGLGAEAAVEVPEQPLGTTKEEV